MPVTDVISDFLTRVRNAGAARHKTVDTPFSNMKYNVAAILKQQGYIEDYEKIEEGPQGILRVTLRYYQREPAFRNIKRISKPGRRVYTNVKALPRVKNGLGIAVVSTSKGVMSDKEARKMNVGGEILCTIW
jgi:small subunit ribosomal protein S8